MMRGSTMSNGDRVEEKWVTIMGSFVADLAFRTAQLPARAYRAG
jgi:hypothetical protein